MTTQLFKNNYYKVTTIHNPKNIVTKHNKLVDELLVRDRCDEQYATLMAYIQLQKDGDCDVKFNN